MQHLQDVDELITEAVLERRTLALDPAWHQQHLFVLHVDALHRADALGEVENLWLAERFGDEPSAILLPDHRWVEAFLDGGPDRERRGEVIALHREVGAIADPEFIDITEQRVGGVTRKNIGESRFDTETHQRQPPRRLPLRLGGELLIAEFDAGQLVGLLRVSLRQAHRHIQIVGAAGQCAVEDRHHETGVDGIDHMGDGVLTDEIGDRLFRTCVDADGAEARVVDRVGRLLGLGLVIVGNHDLLEEVPPHRDRTECRTDAARAHQENSHGRTVLNFAAVWLTYTTTSRPTIPRNVTLGLYAGSPSI